MPYPIIKDTHAKTFRLGINKESIMSQTVLTLAQLFQWKLNGFVQLDLFPEELEQAKREQSYSQEEAAWIRYIDRQEGETK
jgi:hypothetical protein